MVFLINNLVSSSQVIIITSEIMIEILYRNDFSDFILKLGHGLEIEHVCHMM